MTGDVVLADPPASILGGQWQSDTELRAWFEGQKILAGNVQLDHVGRGLVALSSDLDGGFVLAAGTLVRSYYARVDPVGTNLETYTGSLTFDSAIIGVVFRDSTNEPNSELTLPGVTYRNNFDFDLSGNRFGDTFSISDDRRTIDITMRADIGQDSIRIITAAPSPAGVAVFGAFGLAAMRRRR